MDVSEKYKTPMLPPEIIKSDDQDISASRDFSNMMGSSSLSIPLDLYGHRTTDTKVEKLTPFDVVGNTNTSEGKNENLKMSGPLGMCNDPYCTTCPGYFDAKAFQRHSKTSKIFGAKFPNISYGDADISRVMDPRENFIKQWNQFFAISCLLAVFLDPLFVFLLNVEKENKCIALHGPMTKTIVVLRSMTDFIYFVHILLQFRLAYVAPESTVVGAGDLVDDTKKIARNYLFGYFLLDLFAVLPLPQISIFFISKSIAGSYSAKDLLRTAILVQYVPRLYRFLPLLVGQSPTGLIFESAWTNFVINLLMFLLASHVVGSCWYLFGLQTVNHCLLATCLKYVTDMKRCKKFIDCGHRLDFSDSESYPMWKSNMNASACFVSDGFTYGIYQNAVNLTTNGNLRTVYVYSLFWGFQQISTLAGNQVPSYYEWEVLFTMAITGIGLLLFALLIGNIQNFLQSLGRRKLEMSLRRRDVEQWMKHRRLPEELKRLVRDYECVNWAATRGVNEEMLMENLPEDLQRKIRRHLFKFIEKVRIFKALGEPINDAIRQRLRMKTYVNETKILYSGSHIDKMIFIIRGKIESVGDDLSKLSLSEGEVCGEELLTWYLQHSSANDGRQTRRIQGHLPLSNRTLECTTNVEAFVLRAEDLEEVFERFLRSPLVRGVIREEMEKLARKRNEEKIKVSYGEMDSDDGSQSYGLG